MCRKKMLWLSMDKEVEALVILMEECGELTQACSKYLRKQTGPRKREIKQIIEEAGDVLALIVTVVEAGLIDEQRLMKRVVDKQEKLKKFSNLYE